MSLPIILALLGAVSLLLLQYRRQRAHQRVQAPPPDRDRVNEKEYMLSREFGGAIRPTLGNSFHLSGINPG